MPRQKTIVMGGTDPEALRVYAHRRAVEEQEPYLTFSAAARGLPKSAGHAVVYKDPVTGKREMVMEGLDRETARDFKTLLETAWVNGRISAMLD